MNNKFDFSKIEHLNYVVQRNWWNLPDSFVCGDHDDLDLFVSDEHREELEEIIKDEPLIDTRSPSDGYYPPEIANMMLKGPYRFNNIKIPNDMAYFFALYYHNAVHKNNTPYEEELKRTFLKMFPPTKCEDEGVGYYV